MASFIFGGNTNETPASLAAKRQVAAALIAREGTPQNVGQGINALGNAFGALIANRRANKAQAAGTASANDGFAQIASLLGGGGSTPAPSAVPTSMGDAGVPQIDTSGDHTAFINALLPAAQAASQQTGVDPRIIIAQAAQETGWGKAAPGNNYFGIKSHGVPGGQTLPTTEYDPNGNAYAENDSFRTYDSPQQSVMDYANFLKTNSRYAPMMNAQGIDAQLAALGQSGYATDPNYGSEVGSIAHSLNLPGGAPVAASAGVSPGVQTVAAAMNGGGPQAPATASAMGAQPRPPMAAPQASQGGGNQSAAILAVLNNPFSTDGQKAVASALLQRQMQSTDPEYAIKLQTEQAQLDKLQHPPANYGFTTAQDGTVLRTNPQTGEATPAYAATGGNRGFTADDRKAYGIPDDQAGYMDAKGVPHYLGSSLSGTPSTDDSQAIANGIASGDIPPTTIGKNSKYNAPVTAILARQGTNLAQLSTDWTATQKFYASLDGTAQVRLRQNIDTLQGTLGTIRTLAEQWNAGGFPLLNTANRQAALQGVYGPDANRIVTLLGQQIADVTGEMGSVLMGGNSPTDHALDLAAQNLSADWSYPTLTAALDQFDQNISFRKNAILSSAPADAGNNPYFNPGGGTAASELSGGQASPASSFAPVTLAPAAGAAPKAAPPAAPVRTTDSGVAVPAAGFGDAGAPPQSWLDNGGTAETWKYVPPESRGLFK